MLQANPSLTPAQVKQIIAETAQDRLTAGKDVAYGDGLIDALAAVKRAMGYTDGSYAPNEFPSYFFGTDSVPDYGHTDIPIAVTDNSLPLAVSITIDGDYSCVSRLFGICLGYGWDPDLEMDLYTSNEAGEQGVLVFSSGCPAIGDCGSVGQRETAYVAANAATTHYLLRVYGWDGAANNGKGGTFKYEISNGVDSRGGGTPPPNAPPSASFTVSCAGLSCSFTDSSTDDGVIVDWAWDFGDGDASTAQNPGHSYAAAGTYTVTLTATDDESESASASQSVTVSEPLPSAAVSVESVTYSTEGGKRADKHLVVAIALAHQSGGPVAGATVRVDIYRDGAWASDGSAVTAADGSVAFSLKNAAAGCYVTTIRDISAGGLTWDGANPDPGFCKP
jgi:PKD repeat protein